MILLIETSFELFQAIKVETADLMKSTEGEKRERERESDVEPITSCMKSSHVVSCYVPEMESYPGTSFYCIHV